MNRIEVRDVQEELLEQVQLFKLRHPQVRLWILTPCFGSQCYVNYVNSLIKTIELFKRVDIPLCIEFCRNDSLISRARNNMIARAMSDLAMTHMLFIDNDISWNPVDILKLLLSEKELIGGIYPLKRYNWSRLTKNNPVKELLGKYDQSILKKVVSEEEYIQQNLLDYNVNYLTEKTSIEHSICQIKHVPTGFMMIRREVIEKMIVAFPSTKYTDDVCYLIPEENRFAYALFDCGVEEEHYLSEDWMFCHRWSKISGSIYMDVSIKLTHTGIEDFKGFILSTLV